MYLSIFRQPSPQIPGFTCRSSLLLNIKLLINIFTNDGFNTTVTKFCISCPHLALSKKQFVKRPKCTWRRLTCLSESMYQRGRRLLGTLSGVEWWWKPLLQTPSTLMTHWWAPFLHAQSKLPTVVGERFTSPAVLVWACAGRADSEQPHLKKIPSHTTRRAPPEPMTVQPPDRGQFLPKRQAQADGGQTAFLTPREWNKQRVCGTIKN